MHWRSLPTDHFEYRCWDGEVVVYVKATGDTHQLDAPTSELFATLIAHPGLALDAQGWWRLLNADEEEEAEPMSADEMQWLEGALSALSRLAVLQDVSP